MRFLSRDGMFSISTFTLGRLTLGFLSFAIAPLTSFWLHGGILLWWLCMFWFVSLLSSPLRSRTVVHRRLRECLQWAVLKYQRSPSRLSCVLSCLLRRAFKLVLITRNCWSTALILSHLSFLIFSRSWVLIFLLICCPCCRWLVLPVCGWRVFRVLLPEESLRCLSLLLLLCCFCCFWCCSCSFHFVVICCCRSLLRMWRFGSSLPLFSLPDRQLSTWACFRFACMSLSCFQCRRMLCALKDVVALPPSKMLVLPKHSDPVLHRCFIWAWFLRALESLHGMLCASLVLHLFHCVSSIILLSFLGFASVFCCTVVDTVSFCKCFISPLFCIPSPFCVRCVQASRRRSSCLPHSTRARKMLLGTSPWALVKCHLLLCWVWWPSDRCFCGCCWCCFVSWLQCVCVPFSWLLSLSYWFAFIDWLTLSVISSCLGWYLSFPFFSVVSKVSPCVRVSFLCLVRKIWVTGTVHCDTYVVLRVPNCLWRCFSFFCVHVVSEPHRDLIFGKTIRVSVNIVYESFLVIVPIWILWIHGWLYPEWFCWWLLSVLSICCLTCLLFKWVVGGST